MVSKVYLIGFGMGNPALLTVAAQDALRHSELVIGSARLLEALEGTLTATLMPLVDARKIVAVLQSADVTVASVVMSGDVGFYSGATALRGLLDAGDVEVIPGISTVSYLCAQLGMPWQDVHLVSAHGRAHNAVGAVQAHAKTFVLAGGEASAQALCAQLAERGLGAVTVHVGERLSYPDERIVSGTAAELAQEDFAPLAALLVENDRPVMAPSTPQLPDEAFVRGKVPMTKEEVRALALCKLRVRPEHVVWDVGAGTGSVSVEAARLAREGQVFALERRPEACVLIIQNKCAYGLPHLTVVAGEAPAALAGLPAPDRVFIGGSGGALREIMRAALTQNPALRLCLTAITLETVGAALACVDELGLRNVDITQLSVAKARKVGNSHLMQAHNPVYLIAADGPSAAVAEGEGMR